ncbi:hypothetical protein C8R45DRAFT_1104565 [Mycena sanguinolenta]|nr:hypothetical protein C8R45DRAFT_1104565 [Mycena sanguinolenta]
MPFEALDQDILFTILILCLCDVYTVLSVSMTNKSLRCLSLSKQLWLCHVQNRTFRNTLELSPPNLEELANLSTEQLLRLVKSCVIRPGPLSTRGHSGAFASIIDYEIPLVDVRFPDADLLPGARYTLLRSCMPEEWYIYDVWTARRVWQHTPPPFTMCQIDLVPEGITAQIIFARPASYYAHTLHVEELDLTSGESHEVFNLGFRTVFGTPYAIVGDFLLCSTLRSDVLDPKIILVDWRASTFVTLGTIGLNSSVKLVPGYIITTYLESSPPHQQILAVTALDEILPSWPDRSQSLVSHHIYYPHHSNYRPGKIEI